MANIRHYLINRFAGMVHCHPSGRSLRMQTPNRHRINGIRVDRWLHHNFGTTIRDNERSVVNIFVSDKCVEFQRYGKVSADNGHCIRHVGGTYIHPILITDISTSGVSDAYRILRAANRLLTDDTKCIFVPDNDNGSGVITVRNYMRSPLQPIT